MPIRQHAPAAAAVALLLLATLPLTLPGAVAAGDDCSGGGDAGDGREAATPIVVPATCAGHADEPGDVHDWYSFEVGAGQPVEVRLSATVPWLHVCIHDPSGEAAHCGWAEAEPAGPDDYRLLARAVASSGGRWSLAVEMDDGCACAADYAFTVDHRPPPACPGWAREQRFVAGSDTSVPSVGSPVRHLAVGPAQGLPREVAVDVVADVVVNSVTWWGVPRECWGTAFTFEVDGPLLDRARLAWIGFQWATSATADSFGPASSWVPGGVHQAWVAYLRGAAATARVEVG